LKREAGYMATIETLFQTADWKTEKHVPVIEAADKVKKGEFSGITVSVGKAIAHGASAQGPNTSTVYTQPVAVCGMKTDKPGTIIALSYCNIHGLWRSSKELNVE